MIVYGKEDVRKFLQRMKRSKLTKNDKELLQLVTMFRKKEVRKNGLGKTIIWNLSRPCKCK